MAFSVMFGVLFLILGFAAYVSGGNLELGAQIPFFLFGLIISGSIFTSLIFADLGNKRKAISILTLPASHFEKYLVGWIYSFVIFQLVFVPAFYLVVIIIQRLALLTTDTADTALLDLTSHDHKAYSAFIIYAILHGITFWGSAFFEKLHFIKTSFTFFIFCFMLTWFNLEFMKGLISKKVNGAWPFGKVGLHEEKEFYSFGLPDSAMMYVLGMFMVVVVILWVSAFYRLKEKEV
jgi:hypothetical protein